MNRATRLLNFLETIDPKELKRLEQKFKGKKIRSYNADGTFKSEHKIVGIEDPGEGFKPGYFNARLDKGTIVTGDEKDLDAWVKDAERPEKDATWREK